MAEAMGLGRRTYEYFEAGRGKINVDRIHQFAKILDVDPYAILAAVEIRSADFAIACAEHKLMTLFMCNLQEFDANTGAAVARLDSATIVSGFTRIFAALTGVAEAGNDFLGSPKAGGGSPAEASDEPSIEDGPATDDDPETPEDG
jgi:hypothetical protein